MEGFYLRSFHVHVILERRRTFGEELRLGELDNWQRHNRIASGGGIPDKASKITSAALVGNRARVSNGDEGSRTTSAAFTLEARVLDRDKASRITFSAFFHS